MNNRFPWRGLIAAGALGLSSLYAEVRLPAIFSDHMVLQREKECSLWGFANPGETVTAIMAGKSSSIKTDNNGRWKLRLPELEAGGPYTLTVKGDNTIIITDVVIGEVWLGSGQSNMGMSVSRAQDFAQEQTTARFPLIRMFKEESSTAKTEQVEGKGKWVLCVPNTVGGFSATLYFFGREIHRSLGVPVGLINSSVGGSPIESWISPQAQHASDALKPFFEAAERIEADFDVDAAKAKYAKELAEWDDARSRPGNNQVSRKPLNPLEVRERKRDVGGLFNGKIAPLIPYTIRGVLWYQGEANTVTYKAPFYHHQLALLITDWRAHWGYDFPVAWAQLPNFAVVDRDWPLVREAMLKTLSLKNTGMSVNLDIGEADDIHPKNKQELGRRLSLWALAEVYQKKDIAWSGPLPTTHQVKGDKIVLSFKHIDGGLVARNGELKGFTVAGEDRRWWLAHARIDGDRVVVSSPDVIKPVATRYAWENNPTCSLYNAAGLPASPFRTDDWK